MTIVQLNNLAQTLLVQSTASGLEEATRSATTTNIAGTRVVAEAVSNTADERLSGAAQLHT